MWPDKAARRWQLNGGGLSIKVGMSCCWSGMCPMWYLGRHAMGVDGRSLPGEMPPYRNADLPHGWKPDGLLPTHSSGDGGVKSVACLGN